MICTRNCCTCYSNCCHSCNCNCCHIVVTSKSSVLNCHLHLLICLCHKGLHLLVSLGDVGLHVLIRLLDVGLQFLLCQQKIVAFNVGLMWLKSNPRKDEKSKCMATVRSSVFTMKAFIFSSAFSMKVPSVSRARS